MPDQRTKRQTLIILISISFICGFLAGAGFAIYKIGPRATPVSTHTGNTGGEISEQQAKTITNLETQAAATPNDFQLWTQLGNMYYDTSQAEKAIKAYTRSLELHSGDANLLTDLGVMYRSKGQSKKAIEFFDRAIALDPTHEHSRLNKGIVLMYDLHNPDKAIATWEELLRINPEARTASGDSVRDFIEEVKKERGDTQESTNQ
jgi:cytochrome c-type biogenesis protein CcmH/NrfG